MIISTLYLTFRISGRYQPHTWSNRDRGRPATHRNIAEYPGYVNTIALTSLNFSRPSPTMSSMIDENRRERLYHLISLGLSERATQQVQSLRTDLWRSTGELSFQSLRPLIPLFWSHHPIETLASFRIESPPRPLEFRRIAGRAYSLFLMADSPEWHIWFEYCVASDPIGTYVEGPFPVGVGVYLGRGSSAIDCMPIVNDDWRLQLHQVMWRTSEERTIHVRHTLLEDRHLV